MDKIHNKPAGQEQGTPTMADQEKNRLMAIFEGVSARIIFGITTGAFLTGFLKYIGANDELCGQIAAIAVLAGVIQFFSPIILEKLNRRKPLVALFNALHRILLVMMVFVPLLPISMTARLYTMAGLYLLAYIMVNFVAPATTTMLISFVPQGMRGKYFSIREIYLILTSSLLNIVLGSVLDRFELQNKAYEGYVVMYAVAFLAMLMNLVSYLRMKEPPLPAPKRNISFKKLFAMPLKEKSFRKIILLFFLWGLSVNFSSPFFSVYMVSKLELSYTFITVCSLLNAVSYVLAVRIWGRISDKKSFTYTAMLTMALLGLTHMGWFFSAGGMLLTYPVIVLLHVMSGIAWGGINISLMNIPYEYTPEEGRTVYLGFNSALSGLVGFISSMLASVLVGAMANYHGAFLGMSVSQFQILFAISGVLILLTAVYIRYVILKDKKTRSGSSL